VSLKWTSEESALVKGSKTLQGFGNPQGVVSLSKSIMMGAADAPNAATTTATLANPMMLRANALLT
jgi:hypothetical protein